MKRFFSERRRLLQAQLRASNLDGLLVTRPANWFYLTGFTGDSGALVVTQRGATLITDGRFQIQAKQEAGDIGLRLQESTLYASAGSFLREIRRRGEPRIGFDPTHLTVAELGMLRKSAGRNAKLAQVTGSVEMLRTRKDAKELATMRKAAILAGEVLESVFPLLKPGVQEIEIGAEIEYQMRKRGASGPAFETIVAFGERGALPHARPTAKRLRKNELVVLDLGAILAHYCSDITRTVFVGRAPERIKKWYRAVLEANTAAIAVVGNGIACGEVDAAARKVLAGYRLDRYFVHSTGHGLGLEVHEDPRLARGQKRVLEQGNVVTIEPGVYVGGIGGIRIEDDVAVHEKHSEVLTRIPRDLIEL